MDHAADLGTPTPEAVEFYTRLAYEFGPFLFAILFMLLITYMAHRFYQGVRKRTSPKPSVKERAAYRFFFISSFSFGMVLVVASVGWWFYSHLRPIHAYEIVIVEIPGSAFVTAPAFDRVYHRKIIHENTRNISLYMLIMLDRPFTPGEPIGLDIFLPQDMSGDMLTAGGVGRPHQQSVLHNGTTRARYRLADHRLIDISESDVREPERQNFYAKVVNHADRIRNFVRWTFAAQASAVADDRNVAPRRLIMSQRTSNQCVTPVGTCILPQSGPVGTPCWCNTPTGPVRGTLE